MSPEQTIRDAKKRQKDPKGVVIAYLSKENNRVTISWSKMSAADVLLVVRHLQVLVDDILAGRESLSYKRLD